MYFTATAMIGMIALAGIVTRDSIILVDFIELAMRHGRPLFDAILESRVVRPRPILLTAGAALLSSLPITLRPDLLRTWLVTHLRLNRLNRLHAVRDPRLVLASERKA